MVKTFRSAHATGSAPTSSYTGSLPNDRRSQDRHVQRLRCAFYSEWA